MFKEVKSNNCNLEYLYYNKVKEIGYYNTLEELNFITLRLQCRVEFRWDVRCIGTLELNWCL
jgi:hypothetical protein